MKKIKLLLVLFVLAIFIFVGCGELSDALKLKSFNVNSTSLIFRYLDNFSCTQTYGVGNIQSQIEKETLTNYMTSISLSVKETIAICATMDFCKEKVEAQSAQKFKIYEAYGNNKMTIGGVYSKYIVYVAETKNQKFETHIYYITANSLNVLTNIDYMNAKNNADTSDENISITEIGEFLFSVASDSITKKYSLVDSGNKCTAKYYFDKDRGYLTLEIKNSNSAYSTGEIDTSLFIGGYKNDIIISRNVVSYTNKTVGYKQDFVWEFFDNVYSLRSKVGLAKDTSKYPDLKSILEANVATANAGDNTGYYVRISRDNMLSKTPKVNVLPYYGTEE
ncbi:MAG: hypothetical protein J6T74_03335 [Clostridia bacterium]|nr:hypothetical protein [Clostridia bacterium]